MRNLFASLLFLACLAGTAHASDVVHRCVDAHGSPVFSDQPCTALAATPLQPPAAASLATPDRVPLAGCAATPAALRQRVIRAFAARDPNQLAGLMVWRGYGRSAAIGDIKSLAALVQQPLISIHFGEDDAAPATSTSPPATDDDARILRVRTSGAAGRSTRFDVSRQAGCLWLRFAG